MKVQWSNLAQRRRGFVAMGTKPASVLQPSIRLGAPGIAVCVAVSGVAAFVGVSGFRASQALLVSSIVLLLIGFGIALTCPSEPRRTDGHIARRCVAGALVLTAFGATLIANVLLLLGAPTKFAVLP